MWQSLFEHLSMYYWLEKVLVPYISMRYDLGHVEQMKLLTLETGLIC